MHALVAQSLNSWLSPVRLNQRCAQNIRIKLKGRYRIILIVLIFLMALTVCIELIELIKLIH